jgi:predicted DNA-binding transcriptional regulator YafY
MNRIDRLVAILIHLQSKKLVTAQEIADRFDMSLRTVYRDIRALEESGVPILSEAGRGYSIMQGYHLPPVMFTRNEASALFTAYKMAEKLTDESVHEHFNSAMYKIKSVLRGAELDYIEKLDSHLLVFKSPSAQKPEFPNNFHTIIQQAIVSKQVLKMEYYSSFSKEFTSRKIEPIGLCYYGGKWHVIAFCLLRNEYRDFRLDRIKELLHVYEDFSRKHPPLSEYIPLNSEKDDVFKVVIRVNKAFASEITEHKYYYGFVSEQEFDSFVEMTFFSNSQDWIGYWLLNMGTNVQITSPDSLIIFVREKVAKLANHYL